MDTIKLWTSDYGQILRCRTYATDIASATVYIELKKLGATTKKQIIASAVTGDTDDEGDACYSVEVTIPQAFLSDMTGTWLGAVVAYYPTKTISSVETFTLIVSARPTA
jgi:hypothetical protein